MSVYFCGGELRIDAEDGQSERALLIGTLLMPRSATAELQNEYLGFDIEDEDCREPIDDGDNLLIHDEVELIKRVYKDRGTASEPYVLPVAADIAIGAVPRLMKAVALQPLDGSGLPY